MYTYIYGIAYTVCYVILCKMFMETFANKRKILRRYKGILLLLGLVAGVVISSYFLQEHMFFKIMLNTMIVSSAMWLYFEQGIIRVVILVFLYQGLGVAVDYISITVVTVLGKLIVGLEPERLSYFVVEIFIGVFSQILLFYTILIIQRRFTKDDTEMLTEIEWARFTVLPFFTIISIIAILAGFDITNANGSQRMILLCLAFGIFGMNVFIFYLIHDILKRESRRREDSLLRERAEHETDMFRQIADNYDKQRQREHEYKNQISAISALMKEQKTEELEKYLAKFDKEITNNRFNQFNTNHTLVNAILDTKYQEAKEKGITFIILKISDLSQLWIEDEDIVVILYNLLDNAIEACNKCEDKLIKLKFAIEKESLVISVINTYSEIPIVVNGEYQTSKEDAYMHGIGIKNVKSVVDKYDGSYVIDDCDNVFRFIIMIPQNT